MLEYQTPCSQFRVEQGVIAFILLLLRALFRIFSPDNGTNSGARGAS
jgi:hypothetical protein